MADRTPDQMTVRELLEARDAVRARLKIGTGDAQRAFGSGNSAARDKLLTILREIEAELAEQGYIDDGEAGSE